MPHLKLDPLMEESAAGTVVPVAAEIGQHLVIQHDLGPRIRSTDGLEEGSCVLKSTIDDSVTCVVATQECGTFDKLVEESRCPNGISVGREIHGTGHGQVAKPGDLCHVVERGLRSLKLEIETKEIIA